MITLPERGGNRFKNWVQAKIHTRDFTGSGLSTTIGPSSPQSKHPSSSSLATPTLSAESPSPADVVIDNVSVALGLVQQVGNVVQRAPFIGPAAALMVEILKGYKEVKDTNDKRNSLLANVTDLTRDLCGTILRMEATNHFDLIGRLKADIETYARFLARTSRLIEEYDSHGAITHVASRNELGTRFDALNRELSSFGARFRTNRLVDLAINQSVNTRTFNRVHDMVLEDKLEQWLESPPNMRRKQLEKQNLRMDGTGLWLLEGEKFLAWQDNPGSLWIRGASGAGKSVLSSAVISKLVADKQLFKDLEDSPPPAIAFFYFDFKHNEGPAVDTALRRIVLQLSAQSPHLYRALEKQYTLLNGQTLPTYRDLVKVLKELLRELGRTYIVLDALDECKNTDLESLLDLISTLRGWIETPLHLFITSQPRNIFTVHFRDVTCIVLEAAVIQKDIERFVAAEILKPNFEFWTSRADDITALVVRKSHGMFRLAACLLFELSRRWTISDKVGKILDDLPNDLFGIYDRFLEGIDPDDFVHVERVLRWIIFSARLLTLDQLADAVAFDFSDRREYIYKPDRREGNRFSIIRWLEGLVIIDPYSSKVTLAHASVQDYVLSRRFTHRIGRDLSPSLSHTFIAQICITYLLHFSNHHLDSTTLRYYPLAKYAGQLWCHHLLRSHDRTLLFARAMRLLEGGSQQYRTMISLSVPPFPFTTLRPPLHFCCHNGYIEGVCGLLANGAGINRNIKGETPLSITLAKGHTDIVRILLENNADPNVPLERCGSALQFASTRGDTGAVQLLLKKGANINAEGGEFGSALQAACQKGHAEIVRLLLEEGADMNAKGGAAGCAWQAACRNGHVEVVRLLLEHGADVNATGRKSWTALQAAAMNGHIEVVQLLLQHGADVNGIIKTSGTPLQAASLNGHMEVVRLLLEHDADVNATGGIYRTALQAACRNGHIAIVQLLLENRAEVNVRGGKYATALQAASSKNFTMVIRLLMESGAEVNATGGKYGSALQAASWKGHMEAVRLLLEKSTDLNATAGQASALQLACVKGHREIVQLLLERGAAVNAMGGHPSALQLASSSWDTEIIQLLLDHGADTNGRGGNGGSALYMASENGNKHMVQLLLEKGADVNATGGRYGSALRAAASRENSEGHREVVELLLAHGAIDTRFTGYGGNTSSGYNSSDTSESEFADSVDNA
ncbi:ankyrin repeat-containing domain protein [Mycena latifolia]|nr:ankyrin repeat-containing domain protein [Mycena latifolia]